MVMRVESFIYEELKLYSQFRSTPGGEGFFLGLLKDRFSEYGDYYTIDKNGLIECALLHDKRVVNPYLFCVHTDRVEFCGKSAINTIWTDDEFVHGQLDNILGIAIVKYLLVMGYPISVLFTTKEEITQSTEQIISMLGFLKYSSRSLQVISIDVDEFRDEREFGLGEVTLRDTDGVGFMDLDLVYYLRDKAIENKIPFTKNEVGRTISEAGLVNNLTNGRISGAHVGIPITNYHSLEERARWSSIKFAAELLTHFLHKST
jgi:hypothetical protein